MPTCSGVCANAVAIDGQADADEEHRHHAFAAPLVRDPACRQRKQPERQKPRRRVFQQVRIADAPFAGQRQRRDGGEDQCEHVVEEVTHIQEKEVTAVPIHGGPGAVEPTLYPWPLSRRHDRFRRVRATRKSRISRVHFAKATRALTHEPSRDQPDGPSGFRSSSHWRLSLVSPRAVADPSLDVTIGGETRSFSRDALLARPDVTDCRYPRRCRIRKADAVSRDPAGRIADRAFARRPTA